MLEKQITEILKHMDQALGKYAPDAIEACGRMIVFRAIMDLVASTVVTLGCCYMAKRIYKWWKDDGDYDDDMIGMMGSLVAAITTAASAIWACSVWFDPMTWMALFDQKAWLAAHLLDKLVK